jgi:hypothetical protein
MSSSTHSVRSALRSLCALSLVALGACGTPLVGGECAEGYLFLDGACVAECAPGYLRRDGYCRLAEGELIVLGLDFAEAQPGDTAGQILGNAVYLPDHQPVRILDYRELSAWNSSSVSNTVDLIAGEGLSRRRTVTTRVAKDASDVMEHLDIARTDVLFIHAQPLAEPGDLAALGASWAKAMDRFLAQRGVVIVLTSTEGVDEMSAFLDAAGLIHGAKTEDVSGEWLNVEDDGDILSRGVPDPLPRTPRCTSLTLSEPVDPDLLQVVVSDTGAPVVMRRAYAVDSAYLEP